jgi:hypothetical protein
MTPLTTPQDEQAWAARLRRWGLDDIAPVFIEVLRPLGAIGGQLLMLASPLATTFMSEDRLDQIIETLDDPDRLDQVLSSLDQKAER